MLEAELPAAGLAGSDPLTLAFADEDPAPPSVQEELEGGVVRCVFTHRFGGLLPPAMRMELLVPDAWRGARVRRLSWEPPPELDENGD